MFHTRKPLTAAALRCLLAALLLAAACGDAPMGPNGPGTTPEPPAEPSYDHARGPGASARDLLAADDFDSLVVQVSYVEGFRPTDEGLDILADFLGERVNKPRGIEIQLAPPLLITSQATYTVADIRALEETHRTAYTEGSTLAVHFLFLDGEYSEAANVLGLAYHNTSMIVFAEKIREYSGGAFQPSIGTVEGVVANHEVGHILGLVNNGSAMQTPHQDEPNGRHCDDPDCLMYYAVRTTDFVSNLLGGMPTLDQDCIDDLRANGGR